MIYWICKATWEVTIVDEKNLDKYTNLSWKEFWAEEEVVAPEITEETIETLTDDLLEEVVKEEVATPKKKK